MARPKKAKGSALKSIDDCTRVMGDLLVAITDLEKTQAERDQAVAAAQKKYEFSLDNARARRDDAEASLQDYYMTHADEIEKGGAKFLQLANGRMGRRNGPPALKALNRNWSMAAIKVKVREVLGASFFHAPKEPELDKDKLKAECTDEQLKSVGLKRESEEVFYAEPARLPEVG